MARNGLRVIIVYNFSQNGLYKECLAIKNYDIVGWVKGLTMQQLEELEDAIISNISNPCGDMNYFLKPYMKLVPIHGKMEDLKTSL